MNLNSKEIAEYLKSILEELYQDTTFIADCHAVNGVESTKDDCWRVKRRCSSFFTSYVTLARFSPASHSWEIMIGCQYGPTKNAITIDFTSDDLVRHAISHIVQ